VKPLADPDVQQLIAELRSFAAGLDTRDSYGPDELLMQAAAALAESEAAREQAEIERGMALASLRDSEVGAVYEELKILQERLRSATRALQEIAALRGDGDGWLIHAQNIARAELESLGGAAVAAPGSGDRQQSGEDDGA
jgi:hypothetical protein